MSLEYWFMLPISTIIATIAMASGVEGATFFTPMFILALGLPPEIAIGTGLITEVFGFSSGLFAYARKRTIDYKLGIALLFVTIPLSLLGTFLAGYVPAIILKTILGMGLITIALTFLKTPNQIEIKRLDEDIHEEYGGEKAQTSLVVFTVPGVIIGGQLGALVSSRISQHYLEKGLAILFIIVAVLMLSEVIL